MKKGSKKDYYVVKSQKHITEKVQPQEVFQPLKMQVFLETSNSVGEMGKANTYLVNLNKTITLNQIEKATDIKGLKDDFTKLMTPPEVVEIEETTDVEAVEGEEGSEVEVKEPDVLNGKVLIVKDVKVHTQFEQEQYLRQLLKSFVRFSQNNKIDYIVSYHNGEVEALKVPEVPVRVISKKRRES